MVEYLPILILNYTGFSWHLALLKSPYPLEMHTKSICK